MSCGVSILLDRVRVHPVEVVHMTGKSLNLIKTGDVVHEGPYSWISWSDRAVTEEFELLNPHHPPLYVELPTLRDLTNSKSWGD